tara:strand:+ start:381 stop:590 length:210 start_codon:yes stop_codon:yes gene_type:complete
LILKFTKNFLKTTNNNPRRNPKMTGIELFIVIGGCYAIYTCGMAIATTIDYYSTEKEAKLVKLGKHRQF